MEVSFPLQDTEYSFSDSLETIAKSYLKSILHSLVDITSDRLSFPLKITRDLKNYIDLSLDNSWDVYLSIFEYATVFLVINFLFGMGSPFGIEDYFKWAVSFRTIVYFLIRLLLSILLSILCILSKLILFTIFIGYEILKLSYCLLLEFSFKIISSVSFVLLFSKKYSIPLLSYCFFIIKSKKRNFLIYLKAFFSLPFKFKIDIKSKRESLNDFEINCEDKENTDRKLHDMKFEIQQHNGIFFG